MYLKSIEEIKKEQEILIDYSTIMASDDKWTMLCNCGSKNCRKVIKKFVSLPKDIKEKYLELKIVPKYILD